MLGFAFFSLSFFLYIQEKRNLNLGIEALEVRKNKGFEVLLHNPGIRKSSFKLFVNDKFCGEFELNAGEYAWIKINSSLDCTKPVRVEVISGFSRTFLLSCS